MKKKAGSQKGFTFVEVLVIVAIVGMLVPIVAGSIFQIIGGTNRNNAKVIALADIDHAVSWLNQDLLMAQTTNLAFGSPKDLVAGDNLTLNWTDYYSGNTTAHQSLYYLSGTRLIRDYDGQVANIASYLSEVEFSIDSSGKVFTMIVTSSPETVSGRSETKTYRIYRRAE